MEVNLEQYTLAFFDEESFMQLASDENLNVEQVKRGLHTIVPILFLGLLRKQEGLGEFLGVLQAWDLPKLNSQEHFRYLLEESKTEEHRQDELTKERVHFWFDELAEDTLRLNKNFLELDNSGVLKLFSAGISSVYAAMEGLALWDEPGRLKELLTSQAGIFSKAIPAALPLRILPEQEVVTEVEDQESSSSLSSLEEKPVEGEQKAATLLNETEEVSEPGQKKNENNQPEIDFGHSAGWWWLVPVALALILWYCYG